MKKIISIILCMAVLISITACNGNSNEKTNPCEETEIFSLSASNATQTTVPIIGGKVIIDYKEIKYIQIEHTILSKSGATTYYYDGDSITLRKKDSIKELSDFFRETDVEQATAYDIQVGGTNNAYLVKISFHDNTYADLQLKDGLIIGYFVDENGNPFSYDDDNQNIDRPLPNMWRFSSFDQFANMFRFK